jgi:hypothetical protein
MEKRYIFWNKGTSFVAGSLAFGVSFAVIFAAMLFKQYLLGALIFGLAFLVFWKVAKRDRA